MDKELERIKDEHIARLRTKNVVMIETVDYGDRVHQWSPEWKPPAGP